MNVRTNCRGLPCAPYAKRTTAEAHIVVPERQPILKGLLQESITNKPGATLILSKRLYMLLQFTGSGVAGRHGGAEVHMEYEIS